MSGYVPLAAVGAAYAYMQAPEIIKQSKDWRQRLDVILQEMKEAQRDPAGGIGRQDGRHLSLSVTHLEDVIMRLGMRMKAVNEAVPGSAPNPYPASYDPSSPVVEKTADNLKL